MSKTKPVTALFCRVSTERQRHDRQRTILSDWAKSQRLRVGQYRHYAEKRSGVSTAASRTGLSKLLRDVEAGRVHTVVVDRLDRLSRSTKAGLGILAQLADSGCRTRIRVTSRGSNTSKTRRHCVNTHRPTALTQGQRTLNVLYSKDFH